jgi:hypothetical protein
MDISRFQHAYLLGLAFEQQWPAMLLSVLLCAIAWVRRINRVPEALRERMAWLASPGVLIAAPVYLWGSGAALESLRVMEMLARAAVSWPQAITFFDTIWAIHLSQFVALFAVFFPGFVTALAGDSSIKTKDVAGALWAIAAVAVDTLFLLRMVTPIGPRA